ncbi:MAG: 30S ribosomal protein S15 [Armatimonadetes bacterium]|nr:30S ribosomal protein S15 [Armatimonadota bacterium]
MPLDKQIKSQVINDNAVKTGDTGSAEVQIALLQARILQITDHLKTHKKDFHSRRGLLMMVGKRRRLEAYLKARDIEKYRALMKKLNIREVKPR